MASHVSLMYHIVFSTKHRAPVLVAEDRERLFRHVWGFVKRKNGFLHQAGGVDDHVHLLAEIHQSIPVATFIKDLKTSTNGFIKRESLFPRFGAWQVGDGAFSESWGRKPGLIAYIKGQAEHHKHESFVDEFKRLCREAGIEFDERFLE